MLRRIEHGILSGVRIILGFAIFGLVMIAFSVSIIAHYLGKID